MSAQTETVWRLPKGSYRLPDSPRAHLMLATTVTERDDLFAACMAVGASLAGVGRPVLLGEPRSQRRRHAGVFSTALARGVADIVAARFRELSPRVRGPVCCLELPPEADEMAVLLDRLAAALPVSGVCIAALPAVRFRDLVDAEELSVDSALLLADLPRDRALVALVCGELSRRGVRCRVWKRPLKGARKQLAVAGLAPGGTVGAAAERLICGLDLGPSR